MMIVLMIKFLLMIKNKKKVLINKKEIILTDLRQ